MKTIFALMGFVLALAAAPGAMAQTNMPGGVLTQEERTLIRDYFGKKLGEVMGTRKEADESHEKKETAKADKDDDDDAKGRGHKGKGHKAKGKHKGKGKSKGKGRGKGLPPGLAKRSALPPGLQRQLDERGALPKGLRTDDLPDDLEKKLPPIREQFKRVVVDDDVVLIERGTNRVLDILEGVIRGRNK